MRFINLSLSCIGCWIISLNNHRAVSHKFKISTSLQSDYSVSVLLLLFVTQSCLFCPYIQFKLHLNLTPFLYIPYRCRQNITKIHINKNVEVIYFATPRTHVRGLQKEFTYIFISTPLRVLQCSMKGSKCFFFC